MSISKAILLLLNAKPIVVNGKFSTNDFTGWTIEPTAASSSASAGQATVVSGAGTNVLIYQTIALVVGKTYRVRATKVAGLIGIYIGAAPGTTTYAGAGSVAAANTDYTFTATTTSAVLSVVTDGASTSATFTNISVK